MRKRVRIGIIGVCGRGKGLGNIWNDPEMNSVVVAGADVKEENLTDFRERMGKSVFTTTDYRKLLERDDVDAVAVTSPDFCHEEHAVAALQAGKHVFCEKPLAITVEGCDRILEAGKKSKKHLMIGFNMRYMNIFRTMKEIVDSGVIGQVKVVWVRHFVGAGGEFYYHDWHADRKNSTGLLLQKASHDIDMIHWISGSYIKRVAAFGGLDFYGGDKPNDLQCPQCPEKDSCSEEFKDGAPHRNYCVFRKEVNVEDNSHLIMELENGSKATYSQCHFSPDYFRNYTFIGTEGRMENLDDHSKISVLTRKNSSRYQNLSHRTYEIKPAEGSHGGADPLVCRDFVEMLRTGKEPMASPLDGRMSVAVGCAATRSLRAGGKVEEIAPLNP